jgi:hypothetical protein
MKATLKSQQQRPRWIEALEADPLPWLLASDTPAVRHMALRWLLDRPPDHPEVRSARDAAMRADPIAAILKAQRPAGYWEKPGPGYATKYRGTVWQLIFLDQLGADPEHPGVRAACNYVLEHSLACNGRFAASGVHTEASPPPSRVIHCLNGNLLSALLNFGWSRDERVQRAIEWQAHTITGEPPVEYFKSGTSGPGFACVANEGLPCAWGAIKAMRALSRVPLHERSGLVQRAIEQGASFLLSCDPATAMYPMGYGNVRPSGSWFRLGFPSGYVADLLQNLEVLCDLGYAGDRRLEPALKWLVSKQDAQGRWRNEYAYNGKTWVDFERQGQPSKWVTLHACRVLRASFT